MLGKGDGRLCLVFCCSGWVENRRLDLEKQGASPVLNKHRFLFQCTFSQVLASTSFSVIALYPLFFC